MAEEKQTRKTKRILYVEDEEIPRLSISDLIINFFPEVKLDFAEDCVTGVSMARTARYDAIFVDLSIPSGQPHSSATRANYGIFNNGERLARCLRHLSRERGTKIICVTGHNLSEIDGSGYFDGDLIKPIGESSLPKLKGILNEVEE